jgi:flagellar basal body-associated protein FliL
MAGKPAPPAAAAADAVEAPKSGKLLLILPLVATILGVGLGATQSSRLAGVLPGTHAPAAAEGHGEEADAEPAHDEEADEEHGSDGEEEGHGEFYQIEGLIVNPSGSDGRRFLLVNVGFETSNPTTMEELSSKDVVIRDAIVSMLARRTVPELASTAVREALKDSLRIQVNDVLGREAGHVNRLYFTQYVLQ